MLPISRRKVPGFSHGDERRAPERQDRRFRFWHAGKECSTRTFGNGIVFGGSAIHRSELRKCTTVSIKCIPLPSSLASCRLETSVGQKREYQRTKEEHLVPQRGRAP